MKKRKLNKQVKYSIISLSVILLLFTFNVTVSRYLGKLKADPDVIATPVLNLDNNKQIYQIDDMLPGDTREIKFNVSNEENNKKNEVLLEYYFIINLDTQIPLNVELYDITNGNNNKIDITKKENLKNIETETETATKKNYALKLIWDEKDNDYTFAKKPINLKIELKATQA